MREKTIENKQTTYKAKFSLHKWQLVRWDVAKEIKTINGQKDSNVFSQKLIYVKNIKQKSS